MPGPAGRRGASTSSGVLGEHKVIGYGKFQSLVSALAKTAGSLVEKAVIRV